MHAAHHVGDAGSAAKPAWIAIVPIASAREARAPTRMAGGRSLAASQPQPMRVARVHYFARRTICDADALYQ
jgi:hypothetical protein